MPPLQTFSGIGALALAQLDGTLPEVAINSVDLPAGADSFVGFHVVNDVKQGISFSAKGDKLKLVMFQSDLSPHFSWALTEPMTACNDPQRDPCLDCAATGLDRPLANPAEIGPEHPWGSYGKLGADGEWTVSAEDLPKPDWNVRTFEIDSANPFASTYSLAATGLPGEPAVVIAKESMAHVSLAITDVVVSEELADAYSKIQTISLIDSAANSLQLALTFYYDQAGRLVSINGLDAVPADTVDGQMAAAIDAASKAHAAAKVVDPIYLPVIDKQSPNTVNQDVLGHGQQPELQSPLTGSSPQECGSWASVYNWLILAAYNDGDTHNTLDPNNPLTAVGKTICPGYETEMFCQKAWNSQFSTLAILSPLLTPKLGPINLSVLSIYAAIFSSRDNFAITCSKYHGPAISAADKQKIADYDAAALKYAKCPWKNRLTRPNVDSGWYEGWIAYQGSINLAHWALNASTAKSFLGDGNKVHNGFLTNYLTHEANMNTIGTFAHFKKVTFLGHSLGGATAQISAHIFKSAHRDIEVDVWTSGSPSAFATYYGPIGFLHVGAYRNSEKGCGDAAARWFDMVPPLAEEHVPNVQKVGMSRRGWQRCQRGRCHCEHGYNAWDFEHWLNLPSFGQHSQPEYYGRAVEVF